MKLELFDLSTKDQIKMAVVMTAIFIVGFGTARHYYKHSNDSSLNNYQHYTTESENDKRGVPTDNCVIKGNITDKGSKRYYKPGSKGYANVTPEKCFTTETEAIRAGFKTNSKK